MTVSRNLSRVVTIVVTLFALTTGAVAQGTAEQRAACTPDAFRLCSSEIPNVSKIVACMQQKKAQLSPACRAVFRPEVAQR